MSSWWKRTDAPGPWFVVGKDEVRLLRDGIEAFPAMLEAIEAAESEILLEMYWVGADPVGIRFRVRGNNGQELLAPTEIILKREISFNESQALAKEAEEGLLYRDMQSDLVQQILRRLVALKPA